MVDEEVSMAISELETGGEEGLLALKDTSVIGFQIGSFYRNNVDKFRPKGSFEFAMSYVHPNYRREGIGLALKRALIADLTMRGGVESIIGCIYERNQASIKLHQGLGFRKVGDYRDGAKKYLVVRKSL